MSIKITAELVKELRDGTGVSVMQCKNALEEAEGDMEKALVILKKKSSSIAMKKADRTAHDGTIIIKEGIEAMKKQSLDIINPIVQKVGEKIELGNIEIIEGEVLGSYVHGGKSAVIVSLKGGTPEIAKDVAMHITAMKPVFTTSEDITEEDKKKVIEVFEKEVSESDKPEEIKKKMLEGKISTYFKEQTLMDQMFIKNGEITIKQLLQNNKALLVKFIRESIG